jgi:hypothetical protein
MMLSVLQHHKQRTQAVSVFLRKYFVTVYIEYGVVRRYNNFSTGAPRALDTCTGVHRVHTANAKSLTGQPR